jgi:hypothetical protein
MAGRRSTRITGAGRRKPVQWWRAKPARSLYLHFADHAELLQALVAHLDDREQLQAGIAAVQAAGDAAGQIRAWAHLQTWHNPKIAAIARALDSTRHTDPSSAAAWRDRTSNRLRSTSTAARPALARVRKYDLRGKDRSTYDLGR